MCDFFLILKLKINLGSKILGRGGQEMRYNDTASYHISKRVSEVIQQMENLQGQKS